MYTVLGNCTLLGRQTTEGSPSDKLEVVASFCYLGDMLSAASCCELSTTTCVKPPGRSSRGCYQFSLRTTSLSRHVVTCTALVCGAQCSMPVRLGCWQSQTSKCLQRNDRAMIRQIYNVRSQDIVTIRSCELLVQLGIGDLDLILKERSLHWYGHVEPSNSAVKTACDIQVDGKRGHGRPKMTWKQLTEGSQRVEALGYSNTVVSFLDYNSLMINLSFFTWILNSFMIPTVTSMCSIDICFQWKSPACAISTSASNGSHQHVQYWHRLPMEVTSMCSIDNGFQWKSPACAISTLASSGSQQHVQYRHRLPVEVTNMCNINIGFQWKPCRYCTCWWLSVL